MMFPRFPVLPFPAMRFGPTFSSPAFSIPAFSVAPSGYRISSKSKLPLRKYDVISISQDGGRDGWILLPVSYLLMSLLSEGQSLLANQILSRYLKWKLRYIFYGNPKWLGKGSIIFFSKSRMCQYPGVLCYILWIQTCIFDACRLSLHNSTPSHCTILRILTFVLHRCSYSCNRRTINYLWYDIWYSYYKLYFSWRFGLVVTRWLRST